jgi:hypothetical protein
MRGIGLLIVLLMNKISIGQSKVLFQIPEKGKTIESFIPKGFDTIATARGDLNKDQVTDYAIVMGSLSEGKQDSGFEELDSLSPRLLIVLIKDGDEWKLAAKSESAILCKSCGGVFGDPFAGIEIKSGILIVDHYGGSNWRWSYTHKFRYQKDDVYLIGQTTLSYWDVAQCEKLNEFAGTEYEDVNFLTGQYQKKKVSAEGCKLLVNKKGKKAITALIKLKDFSIESN